MNPGAAEASLKNFIPMFSIVKTIDHHTTRLLNSEREKLLEREAL